MENPPTFYSHENLKEMEDILIKVKKINDPKYNSYISIIQNAVDILSGMRNKNDSHEKSILDASKLFLKESSILVIRCIISLYKAFSTDSPLGAEHKRALEIIQEFVEGKTSQNKPSQTKPPTADDFLLASQRLRPINSVGNFDFSDLKRIRDAAVLNSIAERKIQLQLLLPHCTSDSLKLKGTVELKALELVEFQRSIRAKILDSVRKDKTRDLIPNLQAFKRQSRFLEKEKYFDRVNTCQRAEDIRRHKRLQKDLLNSILQHCKDFREFHRGIHVKIIRISKTVSLYHTNHDRERRREEERIDRERMRRLMMEDEDGYRRLLDDKKDRRIHYLLNQTDEFIRSVMTLVEQHKKLHQQDEASRASRTTIETIRTGHDVHEATQELNLYANDDEDVLAKALKENQAPDSSSYYQIAHAIREEIKNQPLILVGGQLKEYQLRGLEWMVSLYNNRLNGILADEMGLGKTIQTISLLAYLMESKRLRGPHIIVVPLSTISNWQLEMQKWCPKLEVVVYKGPQASRKQLSHKIKSGKFNILLTTYEYVMKDKSLLSKISWHYMIVDEGHRMKNQDCKLTSVLNAHYHAPYRLLLTGTPLQNRLPELWALLNFLLPKIFNCCTTFEQWFNAPFANTGERVELNEEETYLVIRRLHKILRPFLLRRLKKEVETQLPDKVEYVVKCQMSCLQKMLYYALQRRSALFSDNSDRPKLAPTLMNTIMQLRKVCNHPFLFQHIEEAMVNNSTNTDPLHSPLIYRVSGKFELLNRIFFKLQAKNHRVLIFCQMTRLMSILEDYMVYAGHTYLRLDGTTKADERARLLDLFNAPDSPYFAFILSTRAGGLGLNLQSADTVILFDSDWNPQQDLQAQDRAHRIGQQNEVRVLRLVTVNSVEEKVLAAARFKLNLDEKVIQAGMFNQSSTSKERKAFLEAILDSEPANEGEEVETADDETLNQMIARSEEEYDFYQKMDETSDKINGLIGEDDLPTWIRESFDELCPLGVDEPPLETTEVISKTPNKTLTLSESQIDETSALTDRTIDFSDSNTLTPLKRKRRGRPALPERIALDNMLNTLQKALDYIKSYETEDHRRISYVFYRLPTRKQLPHYYSIIENPIDIHTMEKKITLSKYKTTNDFFNDFELMISNALTYNPEGSQIFDDANALQVMCENNLDDF